MLLNVELRIVVFAVNVLNPPNSYVLMYKHDNSIWLPNTWLGENESKSFSVKANEYLKEILVTSGNWLELTAVPSIYIENIEEGSLVCTYVLYLPQREQIKNKNFEWIKLDSLHNYDFCILDEQLIKLVGLEGGRYA